MESFSQLKQWAKVAAGFKGGPFFNRASSRPPMTFVEGWPKESQAKFAQPGLQGGKDPTPIDSWNERRNKNV